jgi:hypothetical protein
MRGMATFLGGWGCSLILGTEHTPVRSRAHPSNHRGCVAGCIRGFTRIASGYTRRSARRERFRDPLGGLTIVRSGFRVWPWFRVNDETMARRPTVNPHA